VSQLSERHGINLNELYKWKKQLFEGAVDVFTKKQNGSVSMGERENQRLKDQLISELVQENIILKKLKWRDLNGCFL